MPNFEEVREEKHWQNLGTHLKTPKKAAEKSS